MLMFRPATLQLTSFISLRLSYVEVSHTIYLDGSLTARRESLSTTSPKRHCHKKSFRGNAAGAAPGAVPDRCSTPRLGWGRVRHPACPGSAGLWGEAEEGLRHSLQGTSAPTRGQAAPCPAVANPGRSHRPTRRRRAPEHLGEYVSGEGVVGDD